MLLLHHIECFFQRSAAPQQRLLLAVLLLRDAELGDGRGHDLRDGLVPERALLRLRREGLGLLPHRRRPQNGAREPNVFTLPHSHLVS